MHIGIDTSDILTTLLDLVCLTFANRSLCTDRLVTPLLIQTSSHPLLSTFSPIEPAGLCSYRIYTDDEDDDDKNNNDDNNILHQQRITT